MSNLVDSILARLETLLRYVASGFIALFVLSITHTCFTPLATTQNGGYPPWVIVVAAALTGIIIYAVHTGVIVRFLWWRIVVCMHLRLLNHPWMPTDRSKKAKDIIWELDTARWRRRGVQNPEILAVQRELDKWSSLLNYTYCSSYPMIIITILIKIIHPDQTSPHWEFLLVLGLVLLLFALFSDYKITERELWAIKTYPHTSQNEYW